MSISLVEASKLSLNSMRTGVLEIITNESPLMQLMTFQVVLGNALQYLRENVAATVAFFDPLDTWTESTPTFTQLTAQLRILGGDADVDNFLRRTRGNLQDLEAEVIRLKALAVRRAFEDAFINGDNGVDPKSFDGIDVLCGAGQTVSMGTNGGTLTLPKLDETLDKIRGGPPTMLIMSRRSRRTLQGLVRAAGSFLETNLDRFGMWVEFYNGTPIVIDDYIDDAQTVGTSSDCSTIYAARLGDDGLTGIGAGSGDDDPNAIIQVESLGSLETKDATRTRIKAYVSLALYRADALSRLVGVRP